MSEDSSSGRKEEDLEAMGLIAHSYDALFSIRKRIRKVSDLEIPLRNGLTMAQIGTGILVLFLQVIIFGVFIVPLFGIFGASPPWQLTALWVLGPPILAGQNIIKPMPHGKSIPGTVQSMIRFWLDDPLHRRGLPVPTPKQPHGETLVHYQREWVAFAEYVQDEPWEAPISDRSTEARISFCNATLDEQIDFQKWWDNKAATHLEAAQEASAVTKEEDDAEIGARRGVAANVIGPDDFPTRGGGR